MTSSKLSLLLFLCLILGFSCEQTENEQRPNILFCIADDWGWPHAGVYGDTVVQTPFFDQLAGEGILFEHAFVSSPSCTPSRGAILTGQNFWQLEQGANLWSTLDRRFSVYPLLLEAAGYKIGSWRKSWGPGDLTIGGYDTLRPAGKKYEQGFEQFLSDRSEKEPFCFWLGASDPHRAYEPGTGVASGIDLAAVQVPDFYPNTEIIQSDIADYYYEVNRFDGDVGKAIQLLDRIGELENTIIVVTGDHGMPFPRCKANLYDWGARVPLVIRWGNEIKKAKVAEEFVSLIDLAPTFLEVAGVDIPEEMTGRSLLPILEGEEERSRDFVTFGRERHTPAQASPSMDGYPSRGIRTQEYLYIRNIFPERWPAGVPNGSTHPFDVFADCDDGPTKQFLLNNQDNPDFSTYYEWSFGRRPAEELYRIADDPFQLTNLAQNTDFQSVKQQLRTQLDSVLHATNDPRILSNSEIDFDKFPYQGPYPLNLGN